uniref:4'-phosphopantetheinyl transferase domain-containing protein n=1 Tax=Palpitomonas bilix TaxID=652834 RepID=A0A7S3DE21_9EUKA|mmetsp:Transcript_33057/g.85134  ORF Transcript_33057/g.85134 Transcript_33057/m.85134 type:complete len:131 (+) Transcript_33057:327-719(+)
MAIAGIGVDVAVISRFQQVYARHGLRFLRRCYTAKEQEDFQSKTTSATKWSFLASRWAVKEALNKAVGVKRIDGKEVEVIRRTGYREAPSLEVHGCARDAFVALRIKASHVSISHDGDIATAFVVLEKGQ